MKKQQSIELAKIRQQEARKEKEMERGIFWGLIIFWLVCMYFLVT